MLCYTPLSGLSHIQLTLELTVLDQLPPIVKLGGEGGPSGINVYAIEKSVNGRQRNINSLAMDTDVLKRFKSGWIGPRVQLRPESRHIGGIEFSHHFFAIAAHILSRPL